MIVLDVETTGVDPRKHSIVSIGALEFESPKNQFYGECQVWEGAEVQDEALATNGFTLEDVTDESKQSLEVLMRGFLEWAGKCKERTLAGHNLGGLDLMFLLDSARRLHLDFQLAHRVIDTHSLTYMHIIKFGRPGLPGGGEVPERNSHSDISSHFVQEYVGIPREKDPHNALAGAKWEAEAISRLLYDKALLEEYSGHPIPWL